MLIQDLLRQNKVRFEILKRPEKNLSLPGGNLASVTLLRANHGYRYMLAVLPANRPLDLHEATRAFEGCQLEPASETEQLQFCPDCEAGTLMPFGSHYNVQTLLDRSLSEAPTIDFEEIDGSEIIRLTSQEYRELERPFVVPLTAQSWEPVEACHSTT